MPGCDIQIRKKRCHVLLFDNIGRRFGIDFVNCNGIKRCVYIIFKLIPSHAVFERWVQVVDAAEAGDQ